MKNLRNKQGGADMNMSKKRNAIFIYVISFLACMRPELVPAQNQAQESTVHFGLPTSCIEADVNQADAIAATKVWAETMGRGSKLWDKADVLLLPDNASVIASVKRGVIDIFTISTQDYLQSENELDASPYLAFMQGGQVDNQYLILVRQDSGIKTISDLRGKRLALPRGGRYKVAPLWLDVLLGETGIRETDSFFKEIKEVQKSNQAILPIFFKQIEAGIAIKSVFDTAVTLNPQIGQQLKILTASPKIVMQAICMRNSLPKDKIDQYIKQGLKLHEVPGGLQTLNVTKIDRLVAWTPSYLDNLRELLRKQKMMKSAQQALLPSGVAAESTKLR
jgi:ABC-type phosphate/phosphonate transport system substrate-binding protein